MKSRYRFLDMLRGLNLISMILYHALYNLNYLYGHPMEWYRSTPGYIWQQAICWTFIFLSGFCLELGRPGDVIVLAGKGHETTQEVNGVKYPMDERKIVAEYFENLSKARGLGGRNLPAVSV